MIKLNFAALATGAAIDSHTGNLTLFNMLEEVRVPKDRLPLAIPEVAFVGAFTRLDPSLTSIGFQLDYLMPGGRTIAVNKSETRFQGDRMRVVMRLNGMPIEEFGRHRFRVQWSWKGAGSSEDNEGSFDVFLDVLPADGLAPAAGSGPATVN